MEPADPRDLYHEKLALGASYKTESRVLGMTIEANNTVTSFVPPKELAIENSMGNIHYIAKFRFAPQQGKTSVRLSVSLSTKSKMYVFTKPVLTQLALRELRTDLQALKIAIENNLK